MEPRDDKPDTDEPKRAAAPTAAHINGNRLDCRRYRACDEVARQHFGEFARLNLREYCGQRPQLAG